MNTCYDILLFVFEHHARTSFCIFLCAICMAATLWQAWFTSLVWLASQAVSCLCSLIIFCQSLLIAHKSQHNTIPDPTRKKKIINEIVGRHREASRLLITPEFPTFRKRLLQWLQSTYCIMVLICSLTLAIMLFHGMAYCRLDYCLRVLATPLVVTIIVLFVGSLSFFGKQCYRLLHGSAIPASDLEQNKHKKETFVMGDMPPLDDEEESSSDDSRHNS